MGIAHPVFHFTSTKETIEFVDFDFSSYDSLLSFKPDIIVIRYGENIDVSRVEKRAADRGRDA